VACQTLPVIRRQLSQWHSTTWRTGPVMSYRTPPQWHFPL